MLYVVAELIGEYLGTYWVETLSHQCNQLCLAMVILRGVRAMLSSTAPRDWGLGVPVSGSHDPVEEGVR